MDNSHGGVLYPIVLISVFNPMSYTRWPLGPRWSNVTGLRLYYPQPVPCRDTHKSRLLCCQKHHKPFLFSYQLSTPTPASCILPPYLGPDITMRISVLFVFLSLQIIKKKVSSRVRAQAMLLSLFHFPSLTKIWINCQSSDKVCNCCDTCSPWVRLSCPMHYGRPGKYKH